MRLANYAGRATIVLDGHAIDVEQASGEQLGSDPMLLADLANHDALRAIVAAVTPIEWPLIDDGLLGAPVPRPPKGYGVGLNYKQHAIESGRDMPTEPHLFGKTQNCVAGPYDEVVIPAGLTEIDYEAELVIVFGRTCKAATREEAWSYLAGVTCGQDISDRAEQFRPPLKQFTIAKSYDTFGPIGPYLITADELPNPDALALTGTVSGEVMQEASTDDLIFDVPALVVWLSRYVTFQPGDLVWTGTPGGVGEARGRFLRDGDVIETHIEGIGTMRNPVVER